VNLTLDKLKRYLKNSQRYKGDFENTRSGERAIELVSQRVGLQQKDGGKETEEN
jgi:hypothetical protein